jgi:hypothetical protein
MKHDSSGGSESTTRAAVLLGLRIAAVQHDPLFSTIESMSGSGLHEGGNDRRYVLGRTDGRDLDALGAGVADFENAARLDRTPGQPTPVCMAFRLSAWHSARLDDGSGARVTGEHRRTAQLAHSLGVVLTVCGTKAPIFK